MTPREVSDIIQPLFHDICTPSAYGSLPKVLEGAEVSSMPRRHFGKHAVAIREDHFVRVYIAIDKITRKQFDDLIPQLLLYYGLPAARNYRFWCVYDQ